MGCGTVTLKSCLGLISLFFWACAVTLIVIGAIILSSYGQVSDLAQSTDIIVPSAILICVGVFLFIVGLLGCIGGMKRNKAALSVFFILTLLILVGEVVAVAFGYQFRQKAELKLTDKLHDMLEDCAGNTTVSEKEKDAYCNEIDYLQSHLHCCGADTYKDWYNYTGGANYSIPQSCCIEEGCQTPPLGANFTIASETIYTKGCATKASDIVWKYFTWIFVATVIVVILQVLALVATCVMLFRSQETPYLVLDSQGYRV